MDGKRSLHTFSVGNPADRKGGINAGTLLFRDNTVKGLDPGHGEKEGFRKEGETLLPP